MAGDAKELGAGIVRLAEPREPTGATAQNRRRHGDGLDIVDRGRAAIEPAIGRKWRLKTRLALFAFHGFQKRGFLAADIGPGAVVDVKIEIPARAAGVLADQPRLVGLVDGVLQAPAFVDEFAAHIDVGGMGAHGEGGQKAALDQMMGVVAQDLAVLAGARLGLVGIDHQIMGPSVVFLGHEGPFQTGRKTGAATAAQARFLHLLDNPVAALVDDRLGVVPRAACPGTGKRPVVKAI